MANANGSMSKIIVGAIVLTAIGMTGGAFVNNGSEHVEIRKEREQGDKDVMQKVEKVEDIVTEIRLEQRDLSHYIKAKL